MAGRGRGVRISPGSETVRVEVPMPAELRDRIDQRAGPGLRNEWIRTACQEKAERDTEQEHPAQQ